METRISASLGLHSQNQTQTLTLTLNPPDFPNLFTHFSNSNLTDLPFASASLSTLPKPPILSPKTRNSHSLTLSDRALIGAAAGGLAGAFTYVCLLPLDAVKTKLQTKGASLLYRNSIDAIVKTFRSEGILGFYSGISAVIVGSAASSAVYFGTCEFGKSLLATKLPSYPSLLVPPTAGAMGNIVSSLINVPKELITQRMQAGAKGRSWQVLLRILRDDGVLGLYAGYYSATHCSK